MIIKKFKRVLVKTPICDKKVAEQFLGATHIIEVDYDKDATYPYSYGDGQIKSKTLENLLKYMKSENGFGFKLEEIKE